MKNGQTAPEDSHSSQKLSRRAVILNSLGLGAGLAAYLAFPTPADTPGYTSARLFRVAQINPPARALFAAHEQVYARYLMSIAGIANDVVDYDDALYGYMSGGWWRPEQAQSERNARVMEHVATLGWFYGSRRDWNPYFRDPALLARLEAAVSYYTSLQRPDGSYPEYDESPSLAATGFGLVAQAEAYEFLGTVDGSSGSRELLKLSMTRAVGWVMDRASGHWEVPIRAFNQLSGALVGAQRVRQVLPEEVVSQADIDERIEYLCQQGQAPAGYLNELYGVDFEYNFTVTMPDLAWLYRQTQHQSILRLVERYMEFMRHAVIPEPNGGQLMHVPALHTRNVVGAVSRPPEDLLDRGALAALFLEDVPAIALFLASQNEKEDVRAAFQQSDLPLIALEKPHTSPRTWMYGPIAPRGPSSDGRRAIENQLPALQSSRLTRLDVGATNDQYLFLRRPAYYAVSVLGEHQEGQLSTRQLGTLWNPQMGTLLTGSNARQDGEGWETVASAIEFSTRRMSSTSTFYSDVQRSHEIQTASVSGQTGFLAQRTQGRSSVEHAAVWTYWDRGLRFRFWASEGAEFTHRLPLVLKSGDVLKFSDGSKFEVGDEPLRVETSTIVLIREGRRVLFSFGPDVRRTYVSRSEVGAAGGVIHRVGVLFTKELTVDVVFLDTGKKAPVGGEAHVTAPGEIALRVTVDPDENSEARVLRITGEGMEALVADMPAGSRVIEQTVEFEGEVPAELLVSVAAADGSSATTIPVRVPSHQAD
ncbi:MULTISPECIES: hypothetical protein [unclassified Pseudoclavibacter]|uniref:hypothetical protein n=1 Tax=unclassified Pseudoclavibacter TaxID=2615177 RepID=UPI001BAA4A0A|nr:hypothetical protein [Pseudoclavibacter sp. Marseille-Q4354]MBS3180080.1 hypothetical protein [Pseudoclavibacter sp. Marseille-Q4354]